MSSAAPDERELFEIGRRIVVRRRLNPDERRADAAAGLPFAAATDVIGYVVRSDAATLTLATRDGEHHVERAAITHAKPVPEPPRRRLRREQTPDY